MDDCTVCSHPADHHAYNAHDVEGGQFGAAVTHCVPALPIEGEAPCTCPDYRDAAGQTLAGGSPTA